MRPGTDRALRLAGLGAAAAAAVAGGYAVARAWRGPAALSPGLGPELGLPPTTRHLDVPVRDGGSVHVAEAGEGPPIVLLHGVTLTGAVWALQLRDLADRHRVIALDLRGHGDSEPGAAGMTISAMADDLADVLEALDLRRTTVVGHSTGGMVALRFCRRHPQLLRRRVGALVFVSTTARIASPLGLERVVPRAAELVAAGHELLNASDRPIVPDNALSDQVARLVFGHAPDAAAVRETVGFARSMQPSRLVELFGELSRFDEHDPFTGLEVPRVVVVGERDRLTPPRQARALSATLGGARLVVWGSAGHMLMYERRESLDWLLDRCSTEAVRATA